MQQLRQPGCSAAARGRVRAPPARPAARTSRLGPLSSRPRPVAQHRRGAGEHREAVVRHPPVWHGLLRPAEPGVLADLCPVHGCLSAGVVRCASCLRLRPASTRNGSARTAGAGAGGGGGRRVAARPSQPAGRRAGRRAARGPAPAARATPPAGAALSPCAPQGLASIGTLLEITDHANLEDGACGWWRAAPPAWVPAVSATRRSG